MTPPVLTKPDRAFLPGEAPNDARRLPEGRAGELEGICEWHDEWEVSARLELIVVRTPDDNLWGYRRHVNPGEEMWYDDEPLFPVEEKKVTVTTYTKPGGEDLGLG